MAVPSFEDYQIPSNDVRKLCVLCGIQQTEDQQKLPEAVAREYYESRVRADRIGVNFGDHDVWNIVCRAAVRKQSGIEPVKEEPPTVAELLKEKKIKVGDYVMCQWRNKEIPAKIIGRKGATQVVIQMADDSEERTIALTKLLPVPDGWQPPSNK